jgi:hypothetical protein
MRNTDVTYREKRDRGLNWRQPASTIPGAIHIVCELSTPEAFSLDDCFRPLIAVTQRQGSKVCSDRYRPLDDRCLMRQAAIFSIVSSGALRRLLKNMTSEPV